MIITTAGRTNPEMTSLARRLSEQLRVTYVERRKVSVQTLQHQYHTDVLVVGKDRYEIYPLTATDRLFFHPNSAMFRMKRLIKGECDPFIEACDLSVGKTILDCTLGLASDSIVASFTVGHTGRVVGIEGSELIAFLVDTGLKTWETNDEIMNQAMRRIEVKREQSLDFLKRCPNRSFDVVYFDPMFQESIEESDGIKGIKSFAIKSKLTEEFVVEAKRVAKERVVLKDHFRSTSFSEYGMQVKKRKTAKFHYGYLLIE